MKMSGDTLLFVFECEDGYGQQLLRRAVIDNSNNTIGISLDMGKREDGYYTSYMPYPFYLRQWRTPRCRAGRLRDFYRRE